MKKVVIGILFLALVGAGLYFYFGYQSAQRAQASAVQVQTAKVQTGSLTVTISAIGTVRTNQTASLIWQTSGSVEKVNVAVGQQVKKGDVLATLVQTSLPQAVIQAQGNLATDQQALETLTTDAQANKLKAMQDIVTYQQNVRDAQYAIDNFTVPSNMAQYDAVAGVAAMKAILDKARTAFEPYKFLASSDATRTDYLTALNEAQADYNTAVKRLQLEYDLTVAQANLDKANSDYSKWKDGPQQADVDAAEAKIAADQAILNETFIAAPFNGVITLVTPKVGDQVTSSTAAFQIDDTSSLFVDVDVSEIDINQVQPGQEATLVFDAIHNKSYYGKVSAVSMTGHAGSSTNVVDYTVTVQVMDADASVRPGMTAQVDVTVAQKKDVLLVPNDAIQVINGQTVVRVMQTGGAIELVKVSLGLANDTSTEVLDGSLHAGDEVVLNTSAAATPNAFFRGPFGIGGGRPRNNGGGGGNNGGGNNGGGGGAPRP